MKKTDMIPKNNYKLFGFAAASEVHRFKHVYFSGVFLQSKKTDMKFRRSPGLRPLVVNYQFIN